MRPCLFLLVALVLLGNEAEPPHIKAAATAYEAGRAAQRDKQFQRASEYFNKAIEIEPTYMEVREALIGAYLDSGRRLEAASSMAQLLEIRPNALRYRILLGQILLEQGELKKGLAQFSLALKTDPDNPDALLGFANAAERLDMRDRAAEAMERGRKRYPADERFKPSSGTRQP